MNIHAYDILLLIARKPASTQRELASCSGYSLGLVNHSIQLLLQNDYIDAQNRLTVKARQLLEKNSPQNAIILADSPGMHIIPANTEIPIGLLEAKGEILIERIIRQLRECNIREIIIIVGFLKEKFEYLIDKYDIQLIVNPEYSSKNNLHSLKKAVTHITNTYIVPSNLWCRYNPFSNFELYPWYMIGNNLVSESSIRINRKLELVSADRNGSGNQKIGISYLTEAIANQVTNRILYYCNHPAYGSAVWETAIFSRKKMLTYAKLVNSSDVTEINTYEQLQEFNHDLSYIKPEILQVIANTLHTTTDTLTNITPLKKGMTNRSFIFNCGGNNYIIRVSGEGSEKLINRKNEAETYQTLRGSGFCDDPLYLNPDNGCKITAYYENARACDPFSKTDIAKCMEKLRDFHNLKLQVSHEFCLFEQINYYESLWERHDSLYDDYSATKKHIFSLKKYIEAHVSEKALSHIDAVPDNFLFVTNAQGTESLYLIDWEYAGMQDPHIDLAMFSIYSFYTKEQIDELIQVYFKGCCPSAEIYIKIYCYVATCGLLWSNWCEYKRNFGIEFGEYSLRQYRYAKEFFQIVCEQLGEEMSKWDIV